MVKVLRESKQDIENFKEQCKRACDTFGWDYDELIEKYFRMKDSIAAQRREYGDMTALAKKFKEYADIVNKQVKTSEEYTAKMNLEKEVRAILTFIFEFKSKSELQREMKSGYKFIGEENGWKVYFITTVGAAQVMGKGTTWCITGGYPGHEDEAERWFNHYINENCLDGYYFVINNKFDANNPKDTSEYKWCVLKSIEEGSEYALEMYNASQNDRFEGVCDCINWGPKDFPWDLILDREWFNSIALEEKECDDNDDDEQYYDAVFEAYGGLTYRLVEECLVDEMAFVRLEDDIVDQMYDYVQDNLDYCISQLTDDEEEQEELRDLFEEDSCSFLEKLENEGIIEYPSVDELFDYNYTPLEWFREHATVEAEELVYEAKRERNRNDIRECERIVFGDK